jgi:hypothetical protein
LEIPGVGPIVATALIAEVGDWGAFRSGRNLAAWIGLVPKQHSTGGKERLGSITEQGNRYLRWLLVAGAMAVIRYARQHGTKRPWLIRIMDRRPTKVAAVALANNIASAASTGRTHDRTRPMLQHVRKFLPRRRPHVTQSRHGRVAFAAMHGPDLLHLARDPWPWGKPHEAARLHHPAP